MTHTPVGFTGSVDQVGEAKRMSRLGPRFTVASANDWKLELTTADRTVRIKAGSGQACGVTDTTDADETKQFDPNTGGTDRYDLLVARWTWANPVVVPTFEIIKGTPGAGVPDVASLVRQPGTRYDGVLGVLRVRPGVGAFAANDLFDVRMWGGETGPLVSTGIAYLSVRDAPVGTELITLTSPARYTKVSGWADAAIDGTAVPAGAWVAQLRVSRVVSILNAGGGISAPFGVTFTKLISVLMVAGDAAADLAYVIPIAANHGPGSAGGAAYRANGTPVPNVVGNQVRVELDVLAWTS